MLIWTLPLDITDALPHTVTREIDLTICLVSSDHDIAIHMLLSEYWHGLDFESTVEEIMDQKRADNQRSIDNIVERKYRHGTTFLSPLRYYFELCLCLPSEARDYLMESLNWRNFRFKQLCFFLLLLCVFKGNLLFSKLSVFVLPSFNFSSSPCQIR